MTDWKTSLLGIASAALNMFANGTNWKQILFSVGIAGLGILSKDTSLFGKKS